MHMHAHMQPQLKRHAVNANVRAHSHKQCMILTLGTRWSGRATWNRTTIKGTDACGSGRDEQKCEKDRHRDK
jgi:hypothetical protein